MAAETITIRYSDIATAASDLRAAAATITGVDESLDYHMPTGRIGQAGFVLNQSINLNRQCYFVPETLNDIAGKLERVAQLCEETENAAKKRLSDLVVSPDGIEPDTSLRGTGYADTYYAAAQQAIKDKEDADREAKEKADAAAARKEAFLAWLAISFPEAYAAYMQKVHEAEEAEWLEGIKDDPELSWLYDLIINEKKKQEEARKAAEEAAAALEQLGEDGITAGGSSAGADGSSGFGSDGAFGLDGDLSSLLDDSSGSGGGFGGGGGSLGDLGSDFGGGGGLGDLGSGWESDLLDEAIDSGELMDAQGALESVAGANLEQAVGTGLDALAGEADAVGADGGFWGQYGEQLGALAHAYGLQAAAVAGGALALYATREQTTEAVAHVAEFVSTKCKPFASDVMDQVSGAAKKTRIGLGNAKSRVTAVSRGEEVGDLIG